MTMTKKSIGQLFDLNGKGAIVTGGAKGIGQAIAERLAEAGAMVLITDVDLDSAEKTAKEIRATGGNAQAMFADSANGDDAKTVVNYAMEQFGNLHILVNNAGIFPMSPVFGISEEQWDKVLAINLKGVFLYSQAAALAMAGAQNGGRIINIASIDGIRPTGMVAHYNASKGGVIMLTKALAKEFGPMKILVNGIAPGAIHTPGVAQVKKEVAEAGIDISGIEESYLTKLPLQRFGEADDIAKVALFLASDASSYMTGEIVVVDGGSLLMS